MTRTGLLGRLFSHVPEPSVELNAADLDRRGLHAGELVRISSRRGSQVLPVQPSAELRAGTAFIAMHWGSEFVAGRRDGLPSLGVNGLTSPAFDPSSRQPELKHCAVRLDKVDLPGRLLVFGWLPPARAQAVRVALSTWLNRYDYASCVPFGRDEEGVLLRIADQQGLGESVFSELQQLFGVELDDLLRYDDPRRQSTRRLLIRDGRLRFVLLAGDLAPADWLREFLTSGAPVASLGRALLMPTPAAPTGYKSQGRTICNCLGVSERAIRDMMSSLEASPQGRLELVQHELSCGTQCGSCLPELRRLAADPAAVA